MEISLQRGKWGEKVNLVEVYGSLWKSMEVCGSLWKSMEVYGSLWKSMAI